MKSEKMTEAVQSQEITEVVEAAAQQDAAPAAIEPEKKPAAKKAAAAKAPEKKRGGRKPMSEEQKKAAAKARAEEAKKAANMVPVALVQYQGAEIDVAKLVEDAKANFKARHKRTLITELKLYIKPEDYAAYYVINGQFDGKVMF